MLISPPFLLSRQNNESDHDWVSRCMTGDIPGQGSYPVGNELNWHGGLHLTAPPAAAGQVEPVRAIADGKVVYLRKRTEATGDGHPQNYGGGYTSDACVLVEHQTDIGEGANANVTFYSLYHHLHSIDAGIQLNNSVNRKDILGSAGHIYGSANHIHFEICCDDENLSKLVGRRTGPLTETANGRSDVVFGEIYFKLPPQTPVYGEKPLPHLVQASRANPASTSTHPLPPIALTPIYTIQEQAYIGLRYAGGEGNTASRGSAYLTTYVQKRDDNQQLVPYEYKTLTASNGLVPLEQPDAEYNLHADATAISKAYQTSGATNVPAASAIYEMLRFGRIINSQHETLNPTDVPNWQRIRYDGGEGWVNLNIAGVQVFSDADFPHWKGWRLIDDDVETDSACDSAIIKRWLDVDGNGTAELTERQAQLALPSIQVKLERTICKFPSEWDESTIERRWAWRKNRTDENTQPMTDEDFQLMQAHVKAICIPCEPLLKAQWRFAPRQFIATFRKSGWLSQGELKRALPAANANDVSRFHKPICRILQKYIGKDLVARSHLLGQIAHETGNLSGTMAENGNSQASRAYETTDSYFTGADTYNKFQIGAGYEALHNSLGNAYNSGDGKKFRGRGSLQVTGRVYYAAYWLFRGWISQSSFHANWWTKPGWWNDPPASNIHPPIINNPQLISARSDGNEYNPIDVGGWYWVDHIISRRCAGESMGTSDAATSHQVSDAINHYDTGTFEARRLRTVAAKKVLCDGI